MKQRNITLDIAKAIGILLVIIGHCNQIEYMPYRHFIFTFHMPLFFIISGYLFHRKEVKTSLINDAKHILIPYFVTCGVLLVWNFIYFINTNDLSGINWCLQATLWGSGSVHLCRWFSKVPSIGAIWFFPALFVCKNTYNCFSGYTINKRLLISSIIFLTSTLIGRYLLFIPFSVLSGLSAIIYFSIGDYLKIKPYINPIYWFIGALCWYLSFKYSYIFLVQPRTDLYFIDVIGATTASILIYQISRLINKATHISICFSWIGRYTIYILCFHLLDLGLGVSDILASKINLSLYLLFDCKDICIIVFRVIIPLFATWLFTEIKLLISNNILSTSERN